MSLRAEVADHSLRSRLWENSPRAQLAEDDKIILEETVSKKISLNTEAPDFSLNDYSGKCIKLSDYRGKQHVVLVFNRGFK